HRQAAFGSEVFDSEAQTRRAARSLFSPLAMPDVMMRGRASRKRTMPTLDYRRAEPPEPPTKKWDRKFSAWLTFFLSLYCFFAATGDEPRFLWVTFGATFLGL